MPFVAVVVVVFSDAEGVLLKLPRLRSYFPVVIVVDNSPGGTTSFEKFSRDAQVDLIRNGNVGGLAGAYNSAVLQLRSNHPFVTHAMFLDEDTSVEEIPGFLASPGTAFLLPQQDVAAIAPIYRDVATGLRGAHIRLGRFYFKFYPREIRGLVDVAFVINSMSLWKLDAIAQIGQFSTFLSVDHVDTEYCMRARRAGLRVVLNADVEFAQRIGMRRSYRMFGRTLQAGGHSASRRYSIGRNTSCLALRYLLLSPAFAALCMVRLVYEVVGILMAEDRKILKIGALMRGAIVGMWDTNKLA